MRSLLLLVAASSLYANWDNSTTGLDLKKLPKFPLQKVHSGSMRDTKPVTLPGFRIDHFPMGRWSQVSGKGKSGKTWEARFCCIEDIWTGGPRRQWRGRLHLPQWRPVLQRPDDSNILAFLPVDGQRSYARAVLHGDLSP